MMDDTEAAVRTLRTRQASQIGRISQSPAICRNAPVFAGIVSKFKPYTVLKYAYKKRE
jgi:hypothetical protein